MVIVSVIVKETTSTFNDLNLHPALLKTLVENHWLTPTPIQARSIPHALRGKDVLGIAQTGTGKTLAFGLPIVNALPNTEGNALILVPTRELAEQVAQTMSIICQPFKMNTCLLIGGMSMNPQLQSLRRGPRIVIATPGRLIDHMLQGTIRLRNVKYLVMDEADRMLDMGFEPQIKTILDVVPEKRQTMLFSATMPPEIRRLIHKYMNSPETVEVAPAGTVAELVEQELYIVKRDQKKPLLEKLLNDNHGSILVFVRTKRMAAQMARTLHKKFPIAEIHSDRSQSQRRNAIEGFKAGRYRILIATDIAARGIDVKNIQLVINYDLPDEAESYTHRIGRTGRAGKNGKAVSLATPDQGKLVRDIERLMKKSIPLAKYDQAEKLEFTGRTERPQYPRRHNRPNNSHRNSENRSGSSGKKPYGFRRLEQHETSERPADNTGGNNSQRRHPKPGSAKKHYKKGFRGFFKKKR